MEVRDHEVASGRLSRMTRRTLLRASAVAGGLAASARLASGGIAADSTPVAGNGCATPGTALPDAVTAVMRKPRYAKSTWGIAVTDLATGEALYELNPDRKSFTGSCRKLFSVGLALKQLGADHRFVTPVYRRGEVDAQGALAGDLVLVAAGDLTLGGRLNGDDTIAYTDFDHNDANNLGTAILTPQDPLHGLYTLALQVRAAGIRSVNGDVVIDDRLFRSFRVPNQELLITPIMVNENMVDVTIVPSNPGADASVAWRPQSVAFSVEGTVKTTAADTPETVTLSGGGRVQCIGTAGCGGTVSGDIPIGFQAPLSDSPTLVQTFRIEDPAAFARIAFIEALGRAGITVNAPPLGPNPAAKLPSPDSYTPAMRVAAFESPPYAEYAKLILKVSLNLGANLSLMLYGLTQGQQTVTGALAAERRTLVDTMGIPVGGFDFPTNGSGSPDSQATPRATVKLLAEMSRTAVAEPYKDALPVLGINGSLAHTGVALPAKGHAFAKTGTTLDQTGLKAQNLAGYIDARSGRRLAYALFLNDAGPVRQISDVSEVFEDEAVITNAFYEAC